MTRINRAGHHRAERHRAAVIRIRYQGADELSPGLHATAERHGRTITIYLLHGLTAAERDASLRRLRRSGRRGYGPRLPAVPLAFARFADRIRTAIARAGSVFRAHPAGATGPVMLMSAGGGRLPGAVRRLRSYPARAAGTGRALGFRPGTGRVGDRDTQSQTFAAAGG
jgi:hypothetical protein